MQMVCNNLYDSCRNLSSQQYLHTLENLSRFLNISLRYSSYDMRSDGKCQPLPSAFSVNQLDSIPCSTTIRSKLVIDWRNERSRSCRSIRSKWSRLRKYLKHSKHWEGRSNRGWWYEIKCMRWLVGVSIWMSVEWARSWSEICNTHIDDPQWDLFKLSDQMWLRVGSYSELSCEWHFEIKRDWSSSMKCPSIHDMSKLTVGYPKMVLSKSSSISFANRLHRSVPWLIKACCTRSYDMGPMVHER